MKNKLLRFKNIVLPKSFINYLVIGLIVLGIIAGSIFFITISKNDSEIVTKQIIDFFNNVNNNNLNSGLAFTNSMINNTLYIISIFILGLTIIGIPIVIFLIFFKGFILGFSVSSIIAVYKYKGIVGGLLYIFPHQLINIVAILLISIYSINSCLKLIKLIFNKNKINIRYYYKQYVIVLAISLFLIIISSLIEAFVYPLLLKLVIKLFI